MTPSLSRHISLFSLGIAKQWSREKFAFFSLKPPFQRGMVREAKERKVKARQGLLPRFPDM